MENKIKMKCIDNDDIEDLLTVGNVYNVVIDGSPYGAKFRYISDLGTTCYAFMTRFEIPEDSTTTLVENRLCCGCSRECLHVLISDKDWRCANCGNITTMSDGDIKIRAYSKIVAVKEKIDKLKSLCEEHENASFVLSILESNSDIVIQSTDNHIPHSLDVEDIFLLTNKYRDKLGNIEAEILSLY